MAEFPDALIEQAAQALSNHILGAKWVCICGFECWQPDAGNGKQCATASYGVHRQHVARAVLEAVADDLRADAWDEGYQAAADDWCTPGVFGRVSRNPYRERADQIEEGDR